MLFILSSNKLLSATKTNRFVLINCNRFCAWLNLRFPLPQFLHEP
jgi:hypothetical protein